MAPENEGNMKLKLDQEYKSFLEDIKERVRASQYEALKAVNKELIMLYWDIGKRIVEKQEKLGWGKAVVESLAGDLQKEFPGIRGFSADNLWRMRKFYVQFEADAKLAPLVQEISWTKIVVIMESCKDVREREFYINMAKKFGWTKDVLIHHIENQSFQKVLLNQTSFDKTVPVKIRNQAKMAVKDEYIFDFLELGDNHLESELERDLTVNVRRFLLELGGHFCFVANQHRIEVDGREYFVDILLYHRKLRCLVAIELKIGDFKPEYAGKMQFYLSALNDRDKLEEENPAIGIIICKSKSRTVVEYALRDVKKPIGVSTYSLKKSLPTMLKKYLPSSKDWAAKLDMTK
jgi:predicted nuclease of restriction endonuclease-like (RecB) superfamily